MIKYIFSCKNAHKHFIDINLKVKTCGEKSISFQLPSWRPGRYELADFAKTYKNGMLLMKIEMKYHLEKLLKTFGK